MGGGRDFLLSMNRLILRGQKAQDLGCVGVPHPTKDVTLDSGEVSSQQRRDTVNFLGLPNGAQIEVTKSSLDAIGAVWANGKAWLVASGLLPHIFKDRAGDTHWGAWGTFKAHPLQCRCGRHLCLVSLSTHRKRGIKSTICTHMFDFCKSI